MKWGIKLLILSFYHMCFSFERTCVFGYEITWYGADGSIKASNCLQSEPTWMQDNKDLLGSVLVGDLILTGSHDAGAYRQESKKLNCFYIYIQVTFTGTIKALGMITGELTQFLHRKKIFCINLFGV